MRRHAAMSTIAFLGWLVPLAALSVGCGGSEAASGPSATGGAGGTTPWPDASSQEDVAPEERFSFFITSLAALRTLSGNADGFGGDLRFGQADGLSGADEICRQISLQSMPDNRKSWRAFLSVTKGPGGQPVHAIDRIGVGPWYDRQGRLVAQNLTDLAQARPRGADPAIYNDLPNETGTPNHNPDGTGNVDNHDMLTGTNASGTLYSQDWGSTCHDWTSIVGADGRPRCGHPWPTGGFGGTGGTGGPIGGRDGGGGFPPGFDAGGGVGDLANWMSALDESGCAPGVNLVEMGPPNTMVRTVGSGGGYGGFYCFALSP